MSLTELEYFVHLFRDNVQYQLQALSKENLSQDEVIWLIEQSLFIAAIDSAKEK